MYILQSATNRNERGKNKWWLRGEIDFTQNPRKETRKGKTTQKNGERERARNVFPLFLLSALVVDSTTIRETSSKHRVPFNWTNFLLNEEKLHFYLLYVPSSSGHPPSVSGGSSRYPRGFLE